MAHIIPHRAKRPPGRHSAPVISARTERACSAARQHPGLGDHNPAHEPYGFSVGRRPGQAGVALAGVASSDVIRSSGAEASSACVV
ncbi:hypothetical protein GCM10007977_001850 [Dactylosporangium sucinum]|uniref:Uncharacterized protein n=1 Tax=Dactylosporangium sucinum TaxID=1424081 RepID=A0A917SYS3_9ACTN|nr:hypothetical protein GCM10007977_001850 [Dactylosporangium sucinum]